ncbi:hypothetical protein T484DRAFT_1618423, partial [Baffinella frigidus]
QDPSLKEKPIGITQKYLVVTTNYKARELGVQKMTNIDEALKQCPELILLPGEDLTPYRDASKSIYKTLARFGTAAERLGMDEVWVDVTDRCKAVVDAAPSGLQQAAARLSGGGGQAAALAERPNLLLMAGSVIAHEARAAVRAETGFRTSAGIAHNKLLAKLASGLHKPDDQTAMPGDAAAAFLAPLPICSLKGVGLTPRRALHPPPPTSLPPPIPSLPPMSPRRVPRSSNINVRPSPLSRSQPSRQRPAERSAEKAACRLGAESRGAAGYRTGGVLRELGVTSIAELRTASRASLVAQVASRAPPHSPSLPL